MTLTRLRSLSGSGARGPASWPSPGPLSGGSITTPNSTVSYPPRPAACYERTGWLSSTCGPDAVGRPDAPADVVPEKVAMEPCAEYFAKNLLEGSRRSAEQVVPLVLELIRPRSVIDVGCGTGSWLAVFQEAGV